MKVNPGHAQDVFEDSRSMLEGGTEIGIILGQYYYPVDNPNPNP